MAGIKPKHIDVAELHDAFTILEIAESEHAGFFPKGEGAKAVVAGETRIGGKLPINPSGGLKSKGHPVGATGIGQIVEVFKQLTHQAEGRRQIPNQPRIGMAQNMGGTGASSVVHILEVGS